MPYKKPFFGFHTRFGNHDSVDALLNLLEKGLIPLGINALVLEFNPGYSYRCFPEYSNGTVTYEDCVKIREFCKKHGVTPIPLFQCLSHQSDQYVSARPWPLLIAHPEFCERNDVPEDAKWPEFYVHDWCPSNDGIYEYVFPMMDELIEALDADTLHVGIDEVFEIGSDSCPRCKGKDKAELLTHTVKLLHDHLTKKGIKMMMWGDRLLEAEKLGYQTWEADDLGMYKAYEPIREFGRDIVITDWHYDLHEQGYPSLDQFTDGGFSVIAAIGSNDEQAVHFAKYFTELKTKKKQTGSLDGFLFTQWGDFTQKLADEILQGINGAEKTEKHSGINNGRAISAVMTEYSKLV